MAFFFQLEAVLRYRRSMEQKELTALQALLARRNTIVERIQREESQRRLLRDALQRTITQVAMNAAEVQLWVTRIAAMEDAIHSLETQREELQIAIAQQRLCWLEAQKQRDVLESLREIALREYTLVQHRREQASVDELFLIRRKAR